MKALGRHLLIELYGCEPSVLDDVAGIEEHMRMAARKANSTIVNSTFHRFNPYGVSGVVVIAESHLSIHTWPEYGYAAVDIFTCGDSVDPWKAFEYLKSVMKSQRESIIELQRGEYDKIGIEGLEGVKVG
ncbi:adenosylmethionine decarboxylase [Athalassotoga saccharophila]|uniref:adenosylmethionine decarboxylase n=1 Tax=Athalassotoga saccharophila TaxID=1441386 RepID=UPI00137B3C20|nr:adenosylmethionine decarboxylase [Athalassotoga saccharophila]BBJ27265.1 S-adenosylmethionine decarboxylase proenzyme [Athalassotoga saccharophila]